MTFVAPYKWVEDTRLSIPSIDPYSHWMLTHGRDFDFASLRGISKDVAFIGAISEENFDARIKTDRLLIDLLEFELRGNGVKIEEIIQKVTNGISLPHLVRVPLRKTSLPHPLPNSVSSGGMLFGEPNWEPPNNVNSQKVVVIGVIDDAVNIAHRRFREAKSGSRVDFAWSQDGTFVNGNSTVPFGRELTRKDINQAIAKYNNDEAAIHQDLGLVDFARRDYNPLAQRISHGTHVLDLAAGNEPDAEGAVDQRIITVSLPPLVSFDTSGATLSLFFLAALQYILKRTQNIARALGDRNAYVPVFINFSYGLAGGPHNGQHIAERAMEKLVKHHLESGRCGPVQIILPAGNGNLDRGHASKSSRADGTVRLDLPWRLPPGDMTSSYLEIWLPKNASGLKLSIGLPGHQRATNIDLENCPQLLGRLDAQNRIDHATVIARVSRDWTITSDKQRILVAVAPNCLHRNDRDPAPAGLWSVSISAVIPHPGGRIEAWIQRDVSPIGSRLQGRQSYFDDPDYARFTHTGHVRARDPSNSLSVVRRSGTLNGIATGKNTIAVGGYVCKDADKAAAPYTATAGPSMYAPSTAAPSDRSVVNKGILAAGSRSGSRVAINGTSVAAPQVTRTLAKLRYSSGDNGWILERISIPESGPSDEMVKMESDRIGKQRLIK